MLGLNDIKNLWSNFGIIGAAVGSHFVLKGKYNAVLINYPDPQQKQVLLNEMESKFETIITIFK